MTAGVITTVSGFAGPRKKHGFPAADQTRVENENFKDFFGVCSRD